MGMRVIFYDHTDKLRHGNTEPADSLQELLAQSDVVTLHVPETPATARHDRRRRDRRDEGGRLSDQQQPRHRGRPRRARGRAARGRLRGAAIDVFPVEPSSNAERFHSPLQGLDNVILTPHVGGSTEEAQERIGVEVARKLIDYSDSGSTMGAVNFPQVQLPIRPMGTRFIQVQRNLPGMLGRLNEVLARHAINIAAQYLRNLQRRRLRGVGRRRLGRGQPARSRGNPSVGGNHPRAAALRTSRLRVRRRKRRADSDERRAGPLRKRARLIARSRARVADRQFRRPIVTAALTWQ